MFGSTVLEVAIGLILTFLMVSLVTSSVTEAISSAMGWRASTLLAGVKNLLNDQNFQGLAKELYAHALVNPQGDGKTTTPPATVVAGTPTTTPAAATPPTTLPSYIDSRQFAVAFTQTIGLTPTAVAQAAASANPAAAISSLKASTAKVTDPQLRTMLDGIIDRSAGDMGKIEAEVSRWFDTGMAQVSGVYKRHAQAWNFGIALLLAVILNVDAIAIAAALWKQPLAIHAIAPVANLSSADALKQFDAIGLPYGWTLARLDGMRTLEGWVALPGWFITAVATLLGAPFWFDALQKFAQIRGTGSKDKS
jgi:hypothetical protein